MQSTVNRISPCPSQCSSHENLDSSSCKALVSRTPNPYWAACPPLVLGNAWLWSSSECSPVYLWNPTDKPLNVCETTVRGHYCSIFLSNTMRQLCGVRYRRSLWTLGRASPAPVLVAQSKEQSEYLFFSKKKKQKQKKLIGALLYCYTYMH